MGRELRRTHRVAWELAHGPIPSGQVVRHKCDNPKCCNVEHLSLGTQLDNIRDMVERGRGGGPPALNAAKDECLRGHPLTPENVRLYRGSRFCRPCERLRGSEKKAPKNAGAGRRLDLRRVRRGVSQRAWAAHAPRPQTWRGRTMTPERFVAFLRFEDLVALLKQAGYGDGEVPDVAADPA